MSFRQEHSKSFRFTNSELIATSIGITSNHQPISCMIKLENKDYKYYKTKEEILAILTICDTKLKQSAFHRIQRASHYRKDYKNTIFLPEALNNGDYSVLSTFLEKLRNNRVGSYVKLNLEESQGHFLKTNQLTKIIQTITKRRLTEGLWQIQKKSMENPKKVIEKRKTFSMNNKLTRNSTTLKKQEAKIIHVNYAHIDLNFNPEVQRKSQKRIGETTEYCSSARQSKDKSEPKEISIKELLEKTHFRKYSFKIPAKSNNTFFDF